MARFGGKQMRTRHQDGWVEERGTKRKSWYGHFYVYVRDESGKERREHRGIHLGEKARLRKWEAEALLRRTIVSETKGLPRAEHQTLAWFVKERFLPLKAKWQPSTRATNIGILDNQILPRLGTKSLREIDKFACQSVLNELAAADYSASVIDHSRTMLHAIFEEALESDLIGKNPARKLETPSTREPDTTVLPKISGRMLLEALPLRDKLIAMIASFCAMRPGEIFGLTWASWRNEQFDIKGTAWRGTLRPGKAKTRKSKAPVAIPAAILPLLAEWHEYSLKPAENTLIFPSAKGTPMRPENWLRRNVKPAARKLGISEIVNFQVLRRTFATNAQDYGNPKDVQSHLRHADISTTLNVYTQPVSESVRKLVNAVTDEVMASKLVQ
jgi:integrase